MKTTSTDIQNNLLAQLYISKEAILVIANYVIRVVGNIELHPVDHIFDIYLEGPQGEGL
jgi:hypothetical protein